MASERIPFENMSDHDLLVVTAKTVNDMSLRLDSYCQRVNELDTRLRAIEHSDDSPTLSKKQKGAITAVVAGITTAIVELFRHAPK